MILKNKRWTALEHGSKKTTTTGKTPKLSLGYIKIGQVDLETSFQNRPFTSYTKMMKDNLNIKSITIRDDQNCSERFSSYTLDSDDWKQMQIEGLKRGYESRSMR